MIRRVVSSLGVMLLASVVAWSGCKKADAPEKEPAKNPAPEGAPEADAGDSAAESDATAKMSEEEMTPVAAELAKLPAEERAVVEAQELCPVSDEALGSMGPPIKVTVDGKEKPIYVCCEGCIDAVKQDYDKYLAKVEEAKGAAAN